MKRNTLWVLVALLAVCFCFAGCGAQDEPVDNVPAQGDAGENNAGQAEPEAPAWQPSGAITISTSSAAGAAQDLMSRELAIGMEEYFGVPVVVANNSGGGGAVSLSYVMGQPANGLTLLQDGTSLTALLLQTTTDYSMADLIPIGRPNLDVFIMFVANEGKYGSLDELLAACEANPGEIKIGGFGTASGQHIIMMQYAGLAGIDFKWIAYDSGNEAMLALLNGDLDAVVSNTGVINSFAGQITGLWCSAEERLAIDNTIPTLAELGYPELTKYHWRGLFVRSDTPAEIVEALHDGLTYAASQDNFVEYTENNDLLTEYLSLEELAATFDELTASDKVVLDSLGIETK